MPFDLIPFFLGTAYACLGLSGLRLARLDGIGSGWTRLCTAGLAGALLEWYSLAALDVLSREPNDLIGSLLAFVSLGALLEFSRRAVTRRFGLGCVAQVSAGVLIATAGVLVLAMTEGGIYSRVVFTQRSLGLALAGLSLLLIMPYPEKGRGWARAAGLMLLLGLAACPLTGNVWPLIAGLFAAAILLRAVHAVRHRETRGVFAGWAGAEYAAIALLLALGMHFANQRGQNMLRLEEMQFLQLTEAAAAALDPDEVAAIEGNMGDLDRPAFINVSRRLLAIQQAARSTRQPGTSSRFAYLMALRGEHVIFLADQPFDPEQPVQPGEPYDEASKELLQALESGAPFLEGPLADRYGTWVSAFAPVRDQAGTLVALLGIDFDAREWATIEENARQTTLRNWTLLSVIALSIFTSVGLALEAQQQFRRSAQMFRIAADHTASWEYWVDPNGRMLHTSPASEEITGYKPEAFRSHPRQLLRLIHPDDRRRMADHLRSCAQDAPACEFDFRIRTRDGRTAWISHSCHSVYDDDGIWNGRRASNRDITSLRQAEMTLARQERLQHGCQQALRRLLGREGAKYLKDALDLAGQAGGCACVALMQLRPDQSIEPVATWPPGAEAQCPIPWDSLRERVLPILSVGETFELLPRETRDSPGPMRGAHIAILPLLEAGNLWGLAAFAAPPTRDPWSRAEIGTLATLASGLSVALTRG